VAINHDVTFGTALLHIHSRCSVIQPFRERRVVTDIEISSNYNGFCTRDIPRDFNNVRFSLNYYLVSVAKCGAKGECFDVTGSSALRRRVQAGAPTSRMKER
jgi:hypothetical protein